ncbi:DUF4190 domain-containing protein [Nocardioides immobilis]|uniref:DUF4190 domain-containing protein n=1 Tax=Nocardioides immobilis TaxID=2049295 RepID=A0A417Y621_9ACTN|nr:DUF4190 domain-containing protein [Nocardioides immobilis]RHW28017.1 DUF4190 domain-containing protein [Nocardioides immobilis]
MSGPWGGPHDPEPGEPPYQPYGTSPYGTSPYGGAPASPYGPGSPVGRRTDPVSITGFVLSLLCCTSVVGLILGIVGLSRTKDGVRAGRWAAVSAIAIGAVGTLAFVGVVGFFTWFGTSTVLLSSADVGQCVDVDEVGSDKDATLFKKDCDEPHEAEIVVAGDFSSDQVEAYENGGPADVCEVLLGQEYAEAFGAGGYALDIVFEASEPESGDDFICYLERADGDDLDRPID